jgi:hypothetical protein
MPPRTGEAASGYHAPKSEVARLTSTGQQRYAAKGNAGGLLYHPVP